MKPGVRSTVRAIDRAYTYKIEGKPRRRDTRAKRERANRLQVPLGRIGVVSADADAQAIDAYLKRIGVR